MFTQNVDVIQAINAVELVDPLGANEIIDPEVYTLVNERYIYRYKLETFHGAGEKFDGLRAEDLIEAIVGGFGDRRGWPDGFGNMLVDVVIGWLDKKELYETELDPGMTALPAGSVTIDVVDPGSIVVGDSLLIGNKVHVIVNDVTLPNAIEFDPTFEAVSAAEFAAGPVTVRRFGEVPYLIRRALVLWAVRSGIYLTPGSGGSGNALGFVVEERTDNYSYKLNRGASASGANPANDPTSTGYADIDQLLMGFVQPPVAGWV